MSPAVDAALSAETRNAVLSSLVTMLHLWQDKMIERQFAPEHNVMH